MGKRFGEGCGVARELKERSFIGRTSYLQMRYVPLIGCICGARCSQLWTQRVCGQNRVAQ